MSIMKFLRILLNESGMEGMYQFAPGERHVELVAAQAQIARLVAAYDALAPDWSQAPEWAQWYTIDGKGEGNWHVEEPEHNEWRCQWFSAWPHSYGGTVVIPLGIDWRLCKWQRPEVAA